VVPRTGLPIVRGATSRSGPTIVVYGGACVETLRALNGYLVRLPLLILEFYRLITTYFVTDYIVYNFLDPMLGIGALDQACIGTNLKEYQSLLHHSLHLAITRLKCMPNVAIVLREEPCVLIR
jgi:hypothetical protein